MCKISIIIPVYNTEKYLRRCFDSCMSQTLEDIEIIAVNDASPDNSWKIMQEYESLYSDKFRVVLLQTNVRQGGARNVGIRMARGEYITFVDSDDWIDAKMCEELYDKAMSKQADIVFCNVLTETPEGSRVSNRFPDTCVGDVSDRTIPGIIMHRNHGPVAHIIKSELFKDKRNLFPENIFAEDLAITKLWSLKANCIEKVAGAYYHYCFNAESTVNSMQKRNYRNLFQGVKLLYENLCECSVSSCYRQEIEVSCLGYMIVFMKQMGGYLVESDLENAKADFRENVKSMMSENNQYINRWFTPAEKKMLETGCMEGVDEEKDYFDYYNKIRAEIESVFAQLEQDGLQKIAVWSYTKYAKAFQKLFPQCLLIDEKTLENVDEVDCVISLRTGHLINIRTYFGEKRIYDLETFIIRGDMGYV